MTAEPWLKEFYDRYEDKMHPKVLSDLLSFIRTEVTRGRDLPRASEEELWVTIWKSVPTSRWPEVVGAINALREKHENNN